MGAGSGQLHEDYAVSSQLLENQTIFSTMKTKYILAASILTLLSASAHAQISLSTVTIGNPGNADDTTGFGGVGYTYNIGTYEVTLNQYTSFLNAVAATDTYGLYTTSFATSGFIAGIARSGASGSFSYSVIGDGNRPAAAVNWFNAARFTNWLSNGQPAGLQTAATTEDGNYTMNGETGPLNPLYVISKNANATVWIPTENEWYKAAYYDPSLNSGAGGYWLYPTRSNSTPGNVVGSGANLANFRKNGLYSVTQSSALIGTQNYLTPVGAFTNSASAYGTFDQGGNKFEWNDSAFDITDPITGVLEAIARGLRGGEWNFPEFGMQSSYQYMNDEASPGYGFRVAGVAAAPEPGSAALLGLGTLLLAARRRRRA